MIFVAQSELIDGGSSINSDGFKFRPTVSILFQLTIIYRKDSIKRPGAYLIFIIFLHPL